MPRKKKAVVETVEPEVLIPVVFSSDIIKRTQQRADHLRTYLGDKAPQYLLYVRQQRDVIPNEYERIKHLITCI